MTALRECQLCCLERQGTLSLSAIRDLSLVLVLVTANQLPLHCRVGSEPHEHVQAPEAIGSLNVGLGTPLVPLRHIVVACSLHHLLRDRDGLILAELYRELTCQIRAC